MKIYVATISRGNQKAHVMSADGMTGYEFAAVGEESLPLAVDLAVLQTQKGIGVIDDMIAKSEVKTQ